MDKCIFDRLKCYIGFHKWSASLDDYIKEFGNVPMDGRVCKKAKCERCGKDYE